MKTLISMVLGIMIPFIMTDNDDPSLLERISWIPETTLYPYYGSKILDTNQYRFVESVGFHPEDYGNLPIYTWDDVQATLYTVDANEDVAMYRKFIPQKKGNISLVPYGDYVHIINSKGLEYPLEDLVLTKSDTRGISNLSFADEVEFFVKEGQVLILETWRPE